MTDLPSNVYWEDREGYPYFIVTKTDGSTFATWERAEAIAIANLYPPKPPEPVCETCGGSGFGEMRFVETIMDIDVDACPDCVGLGRPKTEEEEYEEWLERMRAQGVRI